MNDHDGPSTQQRVDVGKIIRAGRESHGLTTGDLALRLNLRAGFIEALEEGRGDQYMAWAYERIHIRSIANVLNIDTGLFPQGEISDSRFGN